MHFGRVPQGINGHIVPSFEKSPNLTPFIQPEEVILHYESEEAVSLQLISSLQSQPSPPAAADCAVPAMWKPAQEDLGGSHQLTAHQLAPLGEQV